MVMSRFMLALQGFTAGLAWASIVSSVDRGDRVGAALFSVVLGASVWMVSRGVKNEQREEG